MKKLLFLFTLISLFSCNQEATDFLTESHILENPETADMSVLRTLDQISDAAESAYQIFFDKDKGRRNCHISGIKPIMLSNSRSASDSILFAVNFEEGGYAIMTSAKAVYPLIAIIEGGEYDEAAVFDNPGMAMFLTAAQDSIRDIIKPWEELRQCKDTTIIYSYEYGPLVSVNWGQNGVEGQFCPNKLCGCSNTALAMAMSYFCEPSSILLEFDVYNGETLILNWDDIKLHHKRHIYNTNSCDASPEAHQAIGKLCRQLGKRSGSIYSTTEHATSTSFTYTQSVAKYYLPNRIVSDIFPYKSHVWCTDGIIIMMGASSKDNVAHAWIKDGHSIITTRYEHYEKGSLDPVFVLTHSSESEVHYSHINWGWDGSNNGYFADGYFNTAKSKSYDNLNAGNTSSYNFDTNIKYFYIK